MLYLTLSLLFLVLIPLVYQYNLISGRVSMWVDRVVLGVVTLVIVFHVLPESIEIAGWWVLSLCFVGFLLPLLIEKSLENAAGKIHKATLFVGIFGLVVHGLLDGLSFTGHLSIAEQTLLPLAVLVHRLSVAQLIWSLLVESFGKKTALATLFSLGVSTVIGFYLGERFQYLLHGALFAWFQAFISGALLHVLILRSHVKEHDHSRESNS